MVRYIAIYRQIGRYRYIYVNIIIHARVFSFVSLCICISHSNITAK